MSRPTTLILFYVMFFFSNTASATCVETPTYECLIRFIDSSLTKLDDSEQFQLTQYELFLEAKAGGITLSSLNKYDIENTRLASKSSFMAEESFIQLLKSKEYEQASNKIDSFDAPFSDIGKAHAAALLIEHLILDLQDNTADEIKKMHYGSVLESDNQLIAPTIIEVARHEILGGAPNKGANTLSNTPIDEFSDTYLYQGKLATSILQQESETLFLKPSGSGDCENDSSAALHNSISFFNTNTLSTLEKIAALNHFDLAISTLLDLARLHENAGSCSVYQSMIIGHLIQNVTTAPADSPDSCLKLVQLARSIRRYTDFD